jgi:Uri superfamily endonuclease
VNDADSPGVYHLVLHLPIPTALRVGKLGTFGFPAGYYVYTGSAMGGLRARLDRHRRARKKPWWHIDYLLRRAGIVEVVEVPTRRRVECALNRRVLKIEGARVVARGFGASDCRCEAHLAYFGAVRPDLAAS